MWSWVFRGKSQMLLVGLMLFVVATATLQLVEYTGKLDEAEKAVPSTGFRYSHETATYANDGVSNGTAVEVRLVFGGSIRYANLSVKVGGETAKTWNGTGYEEVAEGTGSWDAGEALRLSCHGDPCEAIGRNDTVRISRIYSDTEIGLSSHTVGG
jgi:hypothetical protein